MKITQLILLLALCLPTGQGFCMDPDDRKPINIIDATNFYQAIYEGNITLVKSMIKNKTINPHRIMRWKAYVVCGGGKFFGGMDYIPVTIARAPANALEDLQEFGFLPLTHAITQNKSEIVKYLVEECKVDVNARDWFGDTALRAALNYHVEMAEYLIERGARPQIKDPIYGRNDLQFIDWSLSLDEEGKKDPIWTNWTAELRKIRPIIEKSRQNAN